MRNKVILVEDVDYVVIDEKKTPQVKKSSKIKAFLLGFVWCFIPLGIIVSLYLAMKDEKNNNLYLYGILTFLLLFFYFFSSIFLT
jgi:hypothetical protein